MSAKDVEAARAAIRALSTEERRRLFTEFGCGCTPMRELVRDSPAAAVGALLGAVAGALLGGAPKKHAVTTCCAICGCDAAASVHDTKLATPQFSMGQIVAPHAFAPRRP